MTQPMTSEEIIKQSDELWKLRSNSTTQSPIENTEVCINYKVRSNIIQKIKFMIPKRKSIKIILEDILND